MLRSLWIIHTLKHKYTIRKLVRMTVGYRISHENTKKGHRQIHITKFEDFTYM